MFRKVLVANRGEIAVRVLRCLRDLRIPSVAVYSEVDRASLHTRLADEAYLLGPAPSSESYMNVERLLDICRTCGADALHPGYGFLSENPAFAKAVEEAGIKFIGPSAHAIERMGSKVAARETATQAGVAVVPGTTASAPEAIAAAAAELGFPVMIKAVAGGGGKGMRRVDRPGELLTALQRASSEATQAFGDSAIYLEKAIEGPRHIEIQILCDAYGDAVHLFERDCSIQRRHQKVIEETPSPFARANGELISQMGDAALKVAKAVNYEGAGTVEFLVDESGAYYFLEMNTRLQVEHPITELCTGIDLVKEQVRIAAGEKLGYGQKDVTRQGHAIQCRVYAEDPAHGFLPSPGPVRRLRNPSGPGVRNDSGVYEGSKVHRFYDPLISKLSVWGSTRSEAIDRMRRALREYLVMGVSTNLAFHRHIMDNAQFIAGDYDTGFIDQHLAELTRDPLTAQDITDMCLGVAGFVAFEAQVTEEPTESQTISPWRSAALQRFR